LFTFVFATLRIFYFKIRITTFKWCNYCMVCNKFMAYQTSKFLIMSCLL